MIVFKREFLVFSGSVFTRLKFQSPTYASQCSGMLVDHRGPYRRPTYEESTSG